MNPKLSVITAAYNAERFIEESILSVLGQTFQDFELIFVNDGSKDGTSEIIKKYISPPKIRLLENEYNEGIAVSRNRALLSARGEYVAIHDADDISLPYRFEQEIDFLDSHPEVTFMGSHAIKISLTGAVTGSMIYPPADTETAFRQITRWKLNPIIDPSSMYRRAPVIEAGGYVMDERLKTSSDFNLWCNLLSTGHLLSNIQEPLIKYRLNPNGVTMSKQSEMLLATDLICATFKRRNFPKVTLRQDYFNQSSFTEYIPKEK